MHTHYPAPNGRLRPLDQDELSPDQRALYDTITNTRGRADDTLSITDSTGALRGPFNSLLHAPRLGGAVQALGAVLRFEGLLDPAPRELLICVVASEAGFSYEWEIHSQLARAAGVREETLDAVQRREDMGDPEEWVNALVKLGREIVEQTTIADETYSAATKYWSGSELLEMVVLAGYYLLIGRILNVFHSHPS